MAKLSNNNFSTVILFDIDYTLFDANKFRRKIFRLIKKKIGYKKISNIDAILRSSHLASRKKTGYFKLKAFLEDIVTNLNIETSPDSLGKSILKEDIFTGNLYEGAKKVLHTLSKNKGLRIGIFSGGDDVFQRRKIEEIEGFLNSEHIHIFRVKNTELPSLIKRYKGHNLYIVDDALEILHASKSLNKNIFVIWVKRKRFDKIQKEIPGFSPDAAITNLKEVIKLVERNFQ